MLVKREFPFYFNNFRIGLWGEWRVGGLLAQAGSEVLKLGSFRKCGIRNIWEED